MGVQVQKLWKSGKVAAIEDRRGDGIGIVVKLKEGYRSNGGCRVVSGNSVTELIAMMQDVVAVEVA